MKLPNTKILIIIAGTILVVLIAVTVFISSLTSKNQSAQQQPTFIPTGVFESNGSESPNRDNPAAERKKLIDASLGINSSSSLSQLPITSPDLEIDFSSKSGQFFINRKSAQADLRLSQVLGQIGLLDLYQEHPELFIFTDKPVSEVIQQMEVQFSQSQGLEDTIGLGNDGIEDTSDKSTYETTQEKKPQSYKQQQIERDRRMLKSFSEFAGSLFTFSTGGSSSLSELIESALTPTQTPTDTGGVGNPPPDTGGSEKGTVRERFSIEVACWQNLGGCTTVHSNHIHIDFAPHGTGTPKCAGGSGGWSSPGSPNLVRFLARVREGGSGVDQLFPLISHGSGFVCKNIKYTTTWSQHSYWNAIDLMVPSTAYGNQVWAWLNGPWEESTN